MPTGRREPECPGHSQEGHGAGQSEGGETAGGEASRGGAVQGLGRRWKDLALSLSAVGEHDSGSTGRMRQEAPAGAQVSRVEVRGCPQNLVAGGPGTPTPGASLQSPSLCTWGL